MKKKLSNKEIVGIHMAVLLADAHDQIMRQSQPEKWQGYHKKLNNLLVRNKESSATIYDAIAAMEKPDPQIEKYNEERVNLAATFSQKDKNGKPVTANNRFVMEDRAGFDAALADLQIKFKEALDKEKADKSLVETTLKEEEEIDIFEIPFDLLPIYFPLAAQEGLGPCLKMEEEKAKA